MFFLLFLLVDRRVRIRIQEAQKHMDPTDPDPQHCFLHFSSVHMFEKNYFSQFLLRSKSAQCEQYANRQCTYSRLLILSLLAGAIQDCERIFQWVQQLPVGFN
jgi:hypothetical protein